MTERLTLTAVETALGPMVVATSSRGVVAVGRELDGMVADLRARLPMAISKPGSSPHAEWLREWAAGRRRDLAPVDLRGLAAFDAEVYRFVAASLGGSAQRAVTWRRHRGLGRGAGGGRRAGALSALPRRPLPSRGPGG